MDPSELSPGDFDDQNGPLMEDGTLPMGLPLEDLTDRPSPPTEPMYLVSNQPRSVVRAKGRPRSSAASHLGAGRIPANSSTKSEATRAWTSDDAEWKF